MKHGRLRDRLEFLPHVIFLGGILYFMPKEVAVAWFGPLFIIFIGLILFSRVITSPWRFGLPIYGLSIGGGILANAAFGFSNQESAELAGITIPLCSTVLMGLGHAFASLVLKRRSRTIDGLSRFATVSGGIALGALAGALLGALIYYLEDFGDIVDLLTDRGDELVITTSTLLGMLLGGYLAATLPASASRLPDES
ncbi:MAG: hypothetical protein AB8G99_02070 [Planctomycetaceae bacterium]